MSDIFDLLQQQLAGDKTLDAISGQINANKQQTSEAINMALPLLMQAMARNTASKNGADSLFKALNKDHDGSILDDVDGFVGNFQNGPGAGILKHLLGDKRASVETGVGNVNGLSKESTAKLLEILAPLVMGQLGRQQRQGGLQVGDLAKLITNVSKQQTSRQKNSNLITQLLDTDGDGNVTEEITQIGLKAIGNLFRRRKG